MRKIPLRVIPEATPDGTIIQFSYRDTLLLALRNGGERGITADEMSVRAPLIVKIEGVDKGAKHLLVEEAEHSTIKEAVTNLRFRVFFHSAIQWKDEVTNAPTVEVEEKEQA